jgi:hypothetical protein
MVGLFILNKNQKQHPNQNQLGYLVKMNIKKNLNGMKIIQPKLDLINQVLSMVHLKMKI